MMNWFKVLALFFILGLLLYGNSLNNRFLVDDYNLLSNPAMSQSKFISSQFNPYLEQQLGYLDPSKTLQGYYRPLPHMVYAFCYGHFKNMFWQYHLFNLFFFVLAAFLVYLCMQKVTANVPLAFLTGLFFLIHPVNGLMVNYIVASVVSLQMIFILLTIVLFWESLERNKNRTFFFLSLLSSFIALMWHDIGIMTPVYLLPVIVFFRKDAYKIKALYILPFVIISLFYLFLRAFFLKGTPFLKDIAGFHMNVWEYAATLFRLVMWQMTQWFYPRSVVMQWVMPVVHDHVFQNCLAGVLLSMIFIVLFIRLAKEKICCLAMTWILIGFAPICLVPFRNPRVGALIEPHWFIFATLGFFIMAAYFFLIVFGRIKVFGLLLLLITVFVWGSFCHAYNRLWADQKTYARFWVKQVPNYHLPYFYLAEAYQQEGALNESEKYYRLALSGDVSDVFTYNNLGILATQLGNFPRAEIYIRQALMINPHYADAYNNLGIAFVKQGQWDKARESFQQALLDAPLMSSARINLALVYLHNKEYRKAVDLCLQNLNIVDNDVDSLFVLIDVYGNTGDIASVRQYAYRLLNASTDPAILNRLGNAMSQMHMNDVAFDCYIKSLRFAPDFAEAYLNAGVLLKDMGKYKEAVHIWRLGLKVAPQDRRLIMEITKALEMGNTGQN